MTTYIVRAIENHDLVGIFSAPNENEHLFDLVDELTSPYNCEYAKFSLGGIFFEGRAPKSASFESIDEYAEREEDLPEPKSPRYSYIMLESNFKWKKFKRKII